YAVVDVAATAMVMVPKRRLRWFTRSPMLLCKGLFIVRRMRYAYEPHDERFANRCARSHRCAGWCLWIAALGEPSRCKRRQRRHLRHAQESARRAARERDPCADARRAW